MSSGGTTRTDSLLALGELVAEHGIRVVVSDLDGVLRVFDASLWDELDAMTGTPDGTSFRAVLGHPYLDDVVRGRGTHARWRELAALGLEDVVGADGRFLLNTADLGAAKPEPEAFTRARARIGRVLGEEIPSERIAFLDDSPRHVAAAARYGWHAVLHRASGTERAAPRLP